MLNIGSYILIAVIIFVIAFGLVRKTPIFDAFTEGARKGIGNALTILPALLGLCVAVGALNASGTIRLLCKALSPIAEFFHFPVEVIPLCILSPVSGSGSLSMLESLLAQYGADSYIGRVASVISGATETTFYAVTIYFGAVGIKKTRHTVPAALCADFTSFILSALTVRFLFD